MKYFEATGKSNKGEGSLNQDCSSASPEHLFDVTITSYRFKIKQFILMNVYKSSYKQISYFQICKKPRDELNCFLEIVSLAVIQSFSTQGSKKDLTDTAILPGSNIEVQQRNLWGILNFLKNLWCLYKSRMADSEDTILLVEIQPAKSEDRASGTIIH